MNKVIAFIFYFFLISCSTSKAIDITELPDYLPYTASKNETTINGKYVECTLEGTIRSFHIGNGKIYGIASSWGNAEAGRTNYANWWTIDLISEDKQWLKIGNSNREYAKQCGAPLIALEESVYLIRRYDGWISETNYFANNRTYGSNRDGLMTQRKMEEGECKLFKEEKNYGACTFADVHPDIKTFMEPYIPKGL